MAGDAEVILGLRYAACLGAGMALDAILQAVLGCTDSLMNRFVPVVPEQVRVIPANEVHIIHTLRTLVVLQTR
jgi:Na+-translocating ferredoxin:NAD+ oxidoreductase RnfE subunit